MKTLHQLSIEIREEHQAAEKAAVSGWMPHARRAGDALIQAREQVKRGRWQWWVSENALVSQETARLYVRIAENWERVKAAASIREARDLLRKPKAVTPVTANKNTKRRRTPGNTVSLPVPNRTRFLWEVKELMPVYGKDTLADTVVAIVCEAYRALEARRGVKAA